MSFYEKVRPAKLLAQARIKAAAAAKGFSEYLSYSELDDPKAVNTNRIHDSGESSEDDQADFLDASDTVELSETSNEVSNNRHNILPNGATNGDIGTGGDVDSVIGAVANIRVNMINNLVSNDSGVDPPSTGSPQSNIPRQTISCTADVHGIPHQEQTSETATQGRTIQQCEDEFEQEIQIMSDTISNINSNKMMREKEQSPKAHVPAKVADESSFMAPVDEVGISPQITEQHRADCEEFEEKQAIMERAQQEMEAARQKMLRNQTHLIDQIPERIKESMNPGSVAQGILHQDQTPVRSSISAKPVNLSKPNPTAVGGSKEVENQRKSEQQKKDQEKSDAEIARRVHEDQVVAREVQHDVILEETRQLQAATRRREELLQARARKREAEKKSHEEAEVRTSDPAVPEDDDIQRQRRIIQQKNKDLDAQEQAMIAQEREESLASLQEEERKANEKEERLQRRKAEYEERRLKEAEVVSTGLEDPTDDTRGYDFNPGLRSTPYPRQSAMANSRPNSRGDGVTFNVQGATVPSASRESKTFRSEFEKTLLTEGGVTEEEQRVYDEVESEEQELPVDNSTITFHVAVSKDDVPMFSGNIIDYKDWRLSFQSIMQKFPTSQHMDVLRKKLGGSESLILGCSGKTTYQLNRAWDILNEEFGDQEKLRRELKTHLRRLLIPYTGSNSQFVNTIRQVRDRFDRLLRVDGCSVVSANKDYIDELFGCMPKWMSNKIIAHSCKPENIKKPVLFNDVLKSAEAHIKTMKRQELYLGNQKTWFPSRGRGAGHQGRGRGRYENINSLSGEGYDDFQETEDQGHWEQEQTDAAINSLHGGRGSSRGGRGRGFVHRGRGVEQNVNSLSGVNSYDGFQGIEDQGNWEQESADVAVNSLHGGRGYGRGVRGRGGGFVQRARGSEAHQNMGSFARKTQRPGMKNAWAMCMICDKEDHRTIDCEVVMAMEPVQLKALVNSRRICVLCGRPDHLSKYCSLHLVMSDVPHKCKKPECSSVPHAKGFCGVVGNT